jgi:hypothetical protein
MRKMKSKIFYVLIAAFFIVGCSSPGDPVNPNPPTPPPPPPPPPPSEILVGKLFFHDNSQIQYDIFMADLYLVLKASTAVQSIRRNSLPAEGLRVEARRIIGKGIHRFRNLEIGGSAKEIVVLNTRSANESIDINLYDIVLKNLENLTNSQADEYAVDVNSNNWIVFVKNIPGITVDPGANEICYMDIIDRVVHQLTPINGKYSGDNGDPNWKDDETIAWVHDRQIMEVNIHNKIVYENVIPELDAAQYDPVFSPDGTKLLFNAWHQRRKKNSFVKYIATSQLAQVLPLAYFNAWKDDNPTWVFSNTRITGHIFMPDYGRIYTRDLDADTFYIITDGTRDFRYVTPVMIGTDIYLIFADWTDESNITLWICKDDGSDLRELNQPGDEPVFHILSLPVPQSQQDMNEIAQQYSLDFLQ